MWTVKCEFTTKQTYFCNISCQACVLSSVCSQQNRPTSAISLVKHVYCQVWVHNKTDLLLQYLLSSMWTVKCEFTTKQTYFCNISCQAYVLSSVCSQQNRPTSAISLVKHVYCQVWVHNKTDLLLQYLLSSMCTVKCEFTTKQTYFGNSSCQACVQSSVSSQQNRPISAIALVKRVYCQVWVHNKTDLFRHYLWSSVCSQQNRPISTISLIKRVFTTKQTYFCNISCQACVHNKKEGAQWLSGRVLDSRPRGWGAAGSSLTGVTALCPWARTLNLA